MESNRIRETFLDFFRSKQHTIVPSAPMVVKNDPTLMFTNAGMNQFKDIFRGNSPAKYPRVADALFERERHFTPVSLSAPVGATVITGANMGGKSVALKTLALNAMLVKAGMLPFAKYAKLPLFGGIFIVSEDLEDMDRGLSSFGAEIVQFNEVEQAAAQTEGISLILLDEFARGTNPEEGAMIVRAVTRYLDNQPSVSVLTTHYDGVAALASAHFEVKGLKDMDMAKVAEEIAASDGHIKGADIIASHMNYGLYRAQGAESCPRDARNICALLALKDEILRDI